MPLSLPSGIVVGFILKYVVPDSEKDQYFIAQQKDCSDLQDTYLQTREDVIIESPDGDAFFCEILGKVFKDEATGNYIQQSVGLARVW